jgi:hypothetical protein
MLHIAPVEGDRQTVQSFPSETLVAVVWPPSSHTLGTFLDYATPKLQKFAHRGASTAEVAHGQHEPSLF